MIDQVSDLTECGVLVMPQGDEAMEILRRVDDRSREQGERLARIETLCAVHLGEDGTVPKLEEKVDKINSKIWMAGGVMAALGFGWDVLKSLAGK